MEIVIRKMERNDIIVCAEILCSVYNNELWQCRWTKEVATEYLTDFFNMQKFVGYVLEEDGAIFGGLFAHEKVWWNNSELFIDEMFILPQLQRSGKGSMLINAAEEYVTKRGLAGLTLSTNKYAPAPLFYRKNGFSDNEFIMFMYKEM